MKLNRKFPDQIKFQGMLKKKVGVMQRANIPPKFLRKFDGYSKTPLPSVVVKNPEVNLCDMDKLVSVVFSNYGYGRFSIMFRNLYVKNKRYSPCAKCIARYRLKKRPKYLRQKHNKLLCKKFRPNWSKRFEVLIVPSDNMRGYEYKHYDNKMHYFWFWKG